MAFVLIILSFEEVAVLIKFSIDSWGEPLKQVADCVLANERQSKELKYKKEILCLHSLFSTTDLEDAKVYSLINELIDDLKLFRSELVHLLSQEIDGFALVGLQNAAVTPSVSEM